MASDDHADRDVSAEEIEQRKKARTGLRVERAVNPPGGRPAPATAPCVGADNNQETTT